MLVNLIPLSEKGEKKRSSGIIHLVSLRIIINSGWSESKRELLPKNKRH